MSFLSQQKLRLDRGMYAQKEDKAEGEVIWKKAKNEEGKSSLRSG